MENIDRREYVRRTRSLLTTQSWTFYRLSRAFKQVRSDSESSIAGPTNNSMNIPTAMQDCTLVRLLSGRTQTAHHHRRWPNRYATTQPGRESSRIMMTSSCRGPTIYFWAQSCNHFSYVVRHSPCYLDHGSCLGLKQ